MAPKKRNTAPLLPADAKKREVEAKTLKSGPVTALSDKTDLMPARAPPTEEGDALMDVSATGECLTTGTPAPGVGAAPPAHHRTEAPPSSNTSLRATGTLLPGCLSTLLDEGSDADGGLQFLEREDRARTIIEHMTALQPRPQRGEGIARGTAPPVTQRDIDGDKLKHKSTDGTDGNDAMSDAPLDSEDETIAHRARAAAQKRDAQKTHVADSDARDATPPRSGRKKRADEKTLSEKKVVMTHPSKVKPNKTSEVKKNEEGELETVAEKDVDKRDPTVTMTGFYDGSLVKRDKNITPKKPKGPVPPSFLPGHESEGEDPPGLRRRDADPPKLRKLSTEASAKIRELAKFENLEDTSGKGATDPLENTLFRSALRELRGADDEPLPDLQGEFERAATPPGEPFLPPEMPKDGGKDDETKTQQSIEQHINISHAHSVSVGSVGTGSQTLSQAPAEAPPSMQQPTSVPPTPASPKPISTLDSGKKESRPIRDTVPTSGKVTSTAADTGQKDGFFYDLYEEILPQILRDSTLVYEFLTTLSPNTILEWVTDVSVTLSACETIRKVDQGAATLLVSRNPELEVILTFLNKRAEFPIVSPVLEMMHKTPQLFKRYTDNFDFANQGDFNKIIWFAMSKLARSYGKGYADAALPPRDPRNSTSPTYVDPFHSMQHDVKVPTVPPTTADKSAIPALEPDLANARDERRPGMYDAIPASVRPETATRPTAVKRDEHGSHMRPNPAPIANPIEAAERKFHARTTLGTGTHAEISQELKCRAITLSQSQFFGKILITTRQVTEVVDDFLINVKAPYCPYIVHNAWQTEVGGRKQSVDEIVLLFKSQEARNIVLKCYETAARRKGHPEGVTTDGSISTRYYSQRCIFIGKETTISYESMVMYIPPSVSQRPGILLVHPTEEHDGHVECTQHFLEQERLKQEMDDAATAKAMAARAALPEQKTVESRSPSIERDSVDSQDNSADRLLDPDDHLRAFCENNPLFLNYHMPRECTSHPFADLLPSSFDLYMNAYRVVGATHQQYCFTVPGQPPNLGGTKGLEIAQLTPATVGGSYSSIPPSPMMGEPLSDIVTLSHPGSLTAIDIRNFEGKNANSVQVRLTGDAPTTSSGNPIKELRYAEAFPHHTVVAAESWAGNTDPSLERPGARRDLFLACREKGLPLEVHTFSTFDDESIFSNSDYAPPRPGPKLDQQIRNGDRLILTMECNIIDTSPPKAQEHTPPNHSEQQFKLYHKEPHRNHFGSRGGDRARAARAGYEQRMEGKGHHGRGGKGGRGGGKGDNRQRPFQPKMDSRDRHTDRVSGGSNQPRPTIEHDRKLLGAPEAHAPSDFHPVSQDRRRAARSDEAREQDAMQYM